MPDRHPTCYIGKGGRVSVQLIGSAGMQSVTDKPTNQCTLKQILEELGEDWIWKHLDLAEGYGLAWLKDAFRNGKELFICDGS